MELPQQLISKILFFVNKSDFKNFRLVNKEFDYEISFLRRNHTYLYIYQRCVNDILSTQRRFNEIFFHGKQELKDIQLILEKFSSEIIMLSFEKCDLNFIKAPSSEILNWLSLTRHLTKLTIVNIEVSKNSVNHETVYLNSLMKLKCNEAILSFITALSLIKVKIFSTDNLTFEKRKIANDFFKRHFKINYLSYTIYNGDDTDVLNCDFSLEHLKLTNLRFTEFRYDISAVCEILKNQKDLIELRLEDGSYSECHEDNRRIESFPPLFDQMLKLSKLQKLYIEMPSDEMMRKIPNKFSHLHTLKICSITLEMLAKFQDIPNFNVRKLCIENLENGKKHLEKGHILSLARSYPNLESFKCDTLPLTVIDQITIHMNKLKKLKIIRNEYLPQKMKKTFNEVVEMQESNLERITCRFEDYKLRILPLIQKSKHLKHVKVYWDNKNTPFMQIMFEIIMASPEISLIDFSFDGVYIKANVISFKDGFTFSYNNREFEVDINKKKGKIICRKNPNL